MQIREFFGGGFAGRTKASLEHAGVTGQLFTVYATLDAPLGELDRAWKAQRDPDIVVFTNGSTFQAFRRQ